MGIKNDLLGKINDAIVDLQSAHSQDLARPFKTLARILKSEEFREINEKLKSDIDLEEFLNRSENTQGGVIGGGKLLWPDSREQQLGLVLFLIERMAKDSRFITDFSFSYFYSGVRISSAIRSMIGTIIIPFARDYRALVLSFASEKPALPETSLSKVFIVHGHDEAALEGLARFIEKIGLAATILREMPNQGRTIIEKFEHSARDIGYAVVIMTPDDLGRSVSANEEDTRTRQNVIFELGYFAGKLGRGRVYLLRKGNVEIPSDLFGVVYTDMDQAGAWKSKLVMELKAAGLEFDANRMWS